jgi:hypothetical protein
LFLLKASQPDSPKDLRALSARSLFTRIRLSFATTDPVLSENSAGLLSSPGRRGVGGNDRAFVHEEGQEELARV